MSTGYEDGLKRMSKLVQSIINRADSGPFREPVDWKALGLYDYPKIIAKMMDLGTVKQKLDQKKYYNAKECADDIRLIWDNCKTYNADGSDFYLLAEGFSKRFEDRYKKIQAEYDTGDTERSSNENKTISLDAKVKFSSQLFRLSGMELGHVLQIIDMKCPHALELVNQPPPPQPSVQDGLQNGKDGNGDGNGDKQEMEMEQKEETTEEEPQEQQKQEKDTSKSKGRKDSSSKGSKNNKRSPPSTLSSTSISSVKSTSAATANMQLHTPYTSDGILQSEMEINVDAIDSSTFAELERYVMEQIQAKTSANINENMGSFKKKARRSSN